MPVLFLQLSSVLVLATILGIIAKTLKQPLLLAYIFSGFIISVLGFFKNVDSSALDLFSNLGIAFLLFLVGIELRIDDLKFVGKAAVLTGIGQIVFTAIVGFALFGGMGFSAVASTYMAIAVTFSSTVIIIKLLAEKHSLKSLHGKLTVGYLLVQDFVAILALMILSGFGASHAPTVGTVVLIFAKGILLVSLSYLASKTVLKSLFALTSTSTELLFVSAITWAFFVAAVGALFGFSIAIGAFLAGIAIASSPYSIQISGRVKPLRDFFTILFFILLGASMSTGASHVLIWQVVLLSAFILVGKPLIVFAILLSLKFRNRTSFMVSISGAQISEFSLILMASGLAIGHVDSSAVSLIATVGIVTITLSSYMISYSDKIYRTLEGKIGSVFPERAHDPYVANREALRNHAVLIGAEQMGLDILDFLKKKFKDKSDILVVDFNPEIIDELRADGFNTVFGDIADPEVMEELELGRAKVIIVTDPDEPDTARLINFAKKKNFRGPIIATSYWLHDALKLYELGADYVVVPDLVGGTHVGKMIYENWDHLDRIKKQRTKHFRQLTEYRLF
ncbi:MAG TPA: cation:proton antiporter family protein [Candidatus Saccharimonadales bacterium]|nr:cation:proton antiporter family protein [Candidatus Saccharimonadales bacterium]